MMHFLAICDYVARHEYAETGETATEKQDRLKKLYDEANQRLTAAIGDVLIDPRLSELQSQFGQAQKDWEEYSKKRNRREWTGASDADWLARTSKLSDNSHQFSADARQLVAHLSTPGEV